MTLGFGIRTLLLSGLVAVSGCHLLLPGTPVTAAGDAGTDLVASQDGPHQIEIDAGQTDLAGGPVDGLVLTDSTSGRDGLPNDFGLGDAGRDGAVKSMPHLNTALAISVDQAWAFGGTAITFENAPAQWCSQVWWMMGGVLTSVLNIQASWYHPTSDSMWVVGRTLTHPAMLRTARSTIGGGLPGWQEDINVTGQLHAVHGNDSFAIAAGQDGAGNALMYIQDFGAGCSGWQRFNITTAGFGPIHAINVDDPIVIGGENGKWGTVTISGGSCTTQPNATISHALLNGGCPLNTIRDVWRQGNLIEFVGDAGLQARTPNGPNPGSAVWSCLASQTIAADLHAIDGLNPNFLITVGANGVVRRWTGSGWDDLPLEPAYAGYILTDVDVSIDSASKVTLTMSAIAPSNNGDALHCEIKDAMGASPYITDCISPKFNMCVASAP